MNNPNAVATLQREESKITSGDLVQYHSAEPSSAALSVAEVKTRLQLIKEVMANAMQEGQDYGKIPGCGEKPGLFQPGAQKLSMMFQLNPEVRQETINEFPQFHRGYRLIVRVTNGSKFADGVGECSTLETKYRYRNAGLKCPSCGKETILKSKNHGEGFFCWTKKGGCGATFPINDPAMNQKQGKVEHENPPDFWNTARKMAFKRAFVHAIINATNTSELWSQDLEDLAANGVMGEAPQHATEATQARQETPKPTNTSPSKMAATKDVLRKDATGETLKWFVGQVEGLQLREQFLAYAIDKCIILPTETLEDWPLVKVPTSKQEFAALSKSVEDHTLGKEGLAPAPEEEEPWRVFPMPFGKNAATPLGELDKKYLFGLWANYTVETEYNGKPKNEAAIAKDTLFRQMLDDAGKHYNFTKQD